jgi:hypothetical protein
MIGEKCSMLGGEDECNYKILVGKSAGKRPFTRPRCRWENHTKMDFSEVHFAGLDWISMDQDSNWWQTLMNVLSGFIR